LTEHTIDESAKLSGDAASRDETARIYPVSCCDDTQVEQVMIKLG
jgi:hypothetical protein